MASGERDLHGSNGTSEHALRSRGGDHQLPSLGKLRDTFGLFLPHSVGHPVRHSGPAGRAECECAQCLAWKAFVHGTPPCRPRTQYEVLTREYMLGLATLVRALHPALGARDCLRVLELGAGDGRLAHFLRAALVDLGAEDEFRVLATDKTPRNEAFPVLEADYRRALDLRPDIVVVAWMPLGQDWTPAIRRCPSVKAFILIGEAREGICGRGFAPHGSASQKRQRPGVDHSWVMKEAVGLSGLQLCFLDEPWCNVRHSQTFLALRGRHASFLESMKWSAGQLSRPQGGRAS